MFVGPLGGSVTAKRPCRPEIDESGRPLTAFMPGTVVVTGATGFVGRNLVARLRDRRGYQVAGFSRTGVPGQRPGVDIGDRAAVTAFFDRQGDIDTVVHLAALAHRPKGIGAAEYDRVNHQGTRHVLDAANASGARRFIFMSTASVYGELRPETVLREEMTLEPVGPYATSKVRAEEYCLSHRVGALTIFRPPAVYAADWLLNVRKRAYLPGTSDRLGIRLIGSEPRYSLCHVSNLTDAVAQSIAGRIASGFYNVSDDVAYTQQAVARAVARLDGRHLAVPVPTLAGRLFESIAPALPEPRRRGWRANVAKLFTGQLLDLSRIKEQGFSPDRTLLEMVREATGS